MSGTNKAVFGTCCCQELLYVSIVLFCFQREATEERPRRLGDPVNLCSTVMYFFFLS